MKAPTRVTGTVLAAILCIFLATQAHALTFNFSDLSSEAIYPGADVLDATLELTINAGAADHGHDLLLVTVTNLTSSPDLFNINQVYFNYDPSGVDPSQFTLDSSDTHSGTTLSSATDSNMANGFGDFDVYLNFGVASSIDPDIVTWSEGTDTWWIDLGGTGFSDTDFSFLSSGVDGEFIPVFASLKFIEGPGDPEASAFGAVVPEPTSLLLLGSGLVGLIGLRKRIK